MAELPRYQQTGRIFADVPQLDFANVRESFRRSQSIASSLDRMSEFAGKFAKTQVEKQAQQFNIDNPITAEQLREAAKTGITAEDLIQKQGGGLVWDEVARKVQASQLRTQLEVEANTAALQIKSLVDTRQITDANEVKAKFMALQDGMSKQLFMLDPDEASRFQTATGALIKSLQKETYDKLYDDYKLANQVKAGDYKVVALETINSIFKTENDPEIINAQLSLIRQRFANLAKEGGDVFALSEVNKLDKEIQDRKINFFVQTALSDNFAKDRYDAMLKIRANNFGEKTALYNSLSEEDKAKIRVATSESWSALESSKDKKEKEEKSNADKAFRNNVIIKARGGLTNINTFDSAFLNGALSFSEWKTANKPESEEGDPLLISQLESKIARGLITDLTQLPAGLNAKAKAKLNDLITKQDAKDAMKIIYIGANVPIDAFSFDENQTQRKTKIEQIFLNLRNQTNPDGTLKYTNLIEAANVAVNEYNKDKTTTDKVSEQKIQFNKATKIVPADKFDYDLLISDSLIEKAAKDKIGWANMSDRDAWIKAVKEYQKLKKQTGLNSSQIE